MIRLWPLRWILYSWDITDYDACSFHCATSFNIARRFCHFVTVQWCTAINAAAAAAASQHQFSIIRQVTIFSIIIIRSHPHCNLFHCVVSMLMTLLRKACLRKQKTFADIVPISSIGMFRNEAFCCSSVDRCKWQPSRVLRCTLLSDAVQCQQKTTRTLSAATCKDDSCNFERFP